MKNILKIGAILILVSGFSVANAQTRDTVNRVAVPGKPITADANEYVYLKNNTIMVHQKNGDVTLSGTYNCTDGSTVTDQGIFTRKDGTVLRLGTGDKVFKDGRFIIAN